jgi:hypothetical protein
VLDHRALIDLGQPVVTAAVQRPVVLVQIDSLDRLK